MAAPHLATNLAYVGRVSWGVAARLQALSCPIGRRRPRPHRIKGCCPQRRCAVLIHGYGCVDVISLTKYAWQCMQGTKVQLLYMVPINILGRLMLGRKTLCMNPFSMAIHDATSCVAWQTNRTCASLDVDMRGRTFAEGPRWMPPRRRPRVGHRCCSGAKKHESMNVSNAPSTHRTTCPSRRRCEKTHGAEPIPLATSPSGGHMSGGDLHDFGLSLGRLQLAAPTGPVERGRNRLSCRYTSQPQENGPQRRQKLCRCAASDTCRP